MAHEFPAEIAAKKLNGSIDSKYYSSRWVVLKNNSIQIEFQSINDEFPSAKSKMKDFSKKFFEKHPQLEPFFETDTESEVEDTVYRDRIKRHRALINIKSPTLIKAIADQNLSEIDIQSLKIELEKEEENKAAHAKLFDENVSKATIKLNGLSRQYGCTNMEWDCVTHGQSKIFNIVCQASSVEASTFLKKLGSDYPELLSFIEQNIYSEDKIGFRIAIYSFVCLLLKPLASKHEENKNVSKATNILNQLSLQYKCNNLKWAGYSFDNHFDIVCKTPEAGYNDCWAESAIFLRNLDEEYPVFSKFIQRKNYSTGWFTTGDIFVISIYDFVISLINTFSLKNIEKTSDSSSSLSATDPAPTSTVHTAQQITTSSITSSATSTLFPPAVKKNEDRNEILGKYFSLR